MLSPWRLFKPLMLMFLSAFQERWKWLLTVCLVLSCLAPSWRWICFFPESYLRDSGKPTHFSLTWSCVTTTQLTHTFIFSTELQRMGWVAEMLKLQKRLRQRHACIAGVGVVFTPSHPSRAPKHEASGWAAGVGMQCFRLLELAMEIKPILQNTAQFTTLHFFPQLFI